MAPSPPEEVALAASDTALAVLDIGLEGLDGVEGFEGIPLRAPLGASLLAGLEGLGGTGEEGFAAGGDAERACLEGGLSTAGGKDKECKNQLWRHKRGLRYRRAYRLAQIRFLCPSGGPSGTLPALIKIGMP